MSEESQSDQACPVCGRHTLAVDEPPRIDIMGVQAYSDILGMGDLGSAASIGIVCLSCDTHWSSKEAFDRGDPDPDVADNATEAGGEANADSNANADSGADAEADGGADASAIGGDDAKE